MSIFEAAIGWLAPPVCLGCGEEGSAFCEACIAGEVTPFGSRCWRCGSLSSRSRTCDRCRQSGTPRHVWASTDYEPIAKKLIAAYKFGHLRAAAEPITSIMADTFLGFNSDKQVKEAGYLIVPVPSATSRLRERGFGHAELLAKILSGKLGLEYKPVLGRIGQNRQVGSSRPNRLSQTAGTYFIKQIDKVKGRNILLVDDVITTGATLRAAAQALRAAGAKQIDALVFAKRL